MNLAGVRRRTVRFWAIVDSSVSYSLALPPLAERFIALLYHINGELGGDPAMPPLDPMSKFFVCLSGSLVAVWCIARYMKPIGLFALIDGWGRVWVSALILWCVGMEHAPRVLLLFVGTEMLGAVAQLREVYFRTPRTMVATAES